MSIAENIALVREEIALAAAGPFDEVELLEVEPHRSLVAVEREVVGGRRALALFLLVAVVGRHPADVVAAVCRLPLVCAHNGPGKGSSAVQHRHDGVCMLRVHNTPSPPSLPSLAAFLST